MLTQVFLALVALVPLVAAILDWALSLGISERHHSHHDTYEISDTLMKAIVMGMVFMGIAGVLFAWLCTTGVFAADVDAILGFFVAFLLVLFCTWLAMRRYSVKLYDDVMEVTPFVGRSVTVAYDDITAMRWRGRRLASGYQSLGIWVGARCRTTIWGGLDIEQILLHIDRFDCLENALGM